MSSNGPRPRRMIGLGLVMLFASLPGTSPDPGSVGAPEPHVPALVSSSEAVRNAFSGHARAKHIPSRVVRRSKSSPERSAFIWPVEGRVVSGFGRRGFLGSHRGVDIKAPQGKPIRAAATGTVSFSGWQSSYGRVITIAHPNGFTTLYAHNQKNFVKAGDRVEPGTVIAAVGRTGRATTNHLHFEIRRQGQTQNPLLLLGRRAPAPMLAKSSCTVGASELSSSRAC